MKVFLLNPSPPTFRNPLVRRPSGLYPPQSLAIIAQGLERGGHDIRLLDAHALHLNCAKIMAEIKRFKPHLLIFNSDPNESCHLPLPSNRHIEDFFHTYSRAGSPAEKVLLIGPHGSLLPDTILETIPSVHYVMRGEPEPGTLEFVEALVRGDPDSTPGISYRQPHEAIAHNPDRGYLKDLDVLPLPAYHLLPMHLYGDCFAKEKRFGMVATSRGCTNSCLAWSKSVFGSEIRVRSIESILEEVDLLIRQYGVETIKFLDPIFLSQRERIDTLLKEIISRRYSLSWHCQTFLFTLEGEILELMARAGCTKVYGIVGSRSSSDQEGGKGFEEDLVKLKELKALEKELGLSLIPKRIIGLPDDTFEGIMEDARSYHSLGFEFQADVAIPYPDTMLFKKGWKEGKIQRKDWRSILMAAGMPGNSFTINELKNILQGIENLNKELKRSHLSWKQKIIKPPVHLIRKCKGRVINTLMGGRGTGG